MSVGTIQICQPNPIKIKAKNKEKLINELNKKISMQLSKVKDGSTMICVVQLVTTTKTI